MLFKNGFELQDFIVIKTLMSERKYTRENATILWFNSNTRYEVQQVLKYDWASPQRLYWELELELSGDDRWLTNPFDM